MTQTDWQALCIYNEASKATVEGSRTRLARALRAARKITSERWSCWISGTLTQAVMGNCNYIGWPIRLRPNGRYL
jgi:hypothetical protein